MTTVNYRNVWNTVPSTARFIATAAVMSFVTVTFPSENCQGFPLSSLEAPEPSMCLSKLPYLCDNHGQPSGLGEDHTSSTASRTERADAPPPPRHLWPRMPPMGTVRGLPPLSFLVILAHNPYLISSLEMEKLQKERQRALGPRSLPRTESWGCRGPLTHPHCLL